MPISSFNASDRLFEAMRAIHRDEIASEVMHELDLIGIACEYSGAGSYVLVFRSSSESRRSYLDNDTESIVRWVKVYCGDA